MITNVYAMESTVLRTEKAIPKQVQIKNSLKVKYTQIFCQEAFNRN